MCLFELGRIEVTPTAVATLTEAGLDLAVYLARHQRGDWGYVEDWEGADHNTRALENRGILWSKYALPDGTELLIGTARDRSYTRVMLFTEFERREVSTREGYALWVDYYDYVRNPLVAVEQPRIDAILGELQVTTALDVGTGTGRLALKLARRGVTVTAFDQSAEMLALAEQKARLERLAIDFHLGSLEEGLPFAPAAFDLVTCALTLCHVPDLDQAASEFCRVLRASGHLLITDFHPDAITSLGWRTHVLRPECYYRLPTMTRTRSEYLRAVEKQGFNLLGVQDVPLRDVPPECMAPDEKLLREHGDTGLLLIILAQKL